MGFLDKLSGNIFGSDQNDRFGGGGRSKELVKTGGLSGLKDIQHDFKRWFGGGGSAPSTQASDTFAALTRERWADYVKTFVPIENQLIDYATNPNTVNNAMTNASENVQGAYEAREGALGRRLQGLGVTLNADEQAASNLSTNLSRSLADVQGQNLARDATMQRQQQILGNPAPDVVRAGTSGMGG